MKRVLQKREEARDYEVRTGDTLESIVSDQCPDIDWPTLARYNFGTDNPKEIRRALYETIGVRTSDLAKRGLLYHPQKLMLEPEDELKPKLKIPEVWKTNGLAINKVHTLKVRALPSPATAIAITNLDKWFIPGFEECEIGYELEGLGEKADLVELQVFGSNYCECTDFDQGRGTYCNPRDLDDVPVYRLLLNEQNQERTAYGMPAGHAWKGQVNATAGMLARTPGMETERCINVAFSPYTVHLRYWKDESDAKARLVLKPFWVQFEETPSEQTAVPIVEQDEIKIQWKNTVPADRGILEIRDRNDILIHRAFLASHKLTAGSHEESWDLTYRAGVLNSKFGTTYLDDSELGQEAENAPYTYKIITFVREKKLTSLKAEWEIRNTDRLERGILFITDKDDRLVFQKPLGQAKLSTGEHSYEWDGIYGDEISNSKGGNIVIAEDMPYRLQIQAHTGIGQDNGLALAAMHTEVRLYVHPETTSPRDIAYDPLLKGCQSMKLSLGPLVPGKEPSEPPVKIFRPQDWFRLQGSSTEWIRYQLARYGFHPGPVMAGDFARFDYEIALEEFKRSVPVRGDVKAPHFRRQTVDTEENDELLSAIKTIRESDKRKWFGDLNRVLSGSNSPDIIDEEINKEIQNNKKEIILWVDDRHYFTEQRIELSEDGSIGMLKSIKDEYNREYLHSSRKAQQFAMNDYRRGMKVRDGKVNLDALSIARPWVPLQVCLRILSKSESLHEVVDDNVGLDRALAEVRAVGPLRVDWTFDEIPPDLSPIYPEYDKRFVRSRYYVNWVINEYKKAYVRPDTGRSATYTNCPGGARNDLGGIRPDDDALNTYYKKVFGFGGLSLSPWKGTAIDSTESIATVTHDHLGEHQKDEKSDLYSHLLGTAGIYFHPSNIAGDGYRVRAQVVFDEYDQYRFPNLEPLKNRYPHAPQAHSAAIRIWRRASIRGYLYWGPESQTEHYPNHLDGVRKYYRAAHVYLVFENEVNKVFDMNSIFDPNNQEHINRYKNIIVNNISTKQEGFRDKNKIKLSRNYVWPWTKEDAIWPYLSAVNIPEEQACKYLNANAMSVWIEIRYALLFSILREVEKQGYLRGHLLVEFRSSPQYYAEEYRCNGDNEQHVYWCYRKLGSKPCSLNDIVCPGINCNWPPYDKARLQATENFVISNWDSEDVQEIGILQFPSNATALGTVWIAYHSQKNSDVWAHEIGHCRHLEHASDAPGAQYSDDPEKPVNANMHDNENNRMVAWTPGQTNAERRWDRECIMSYHRKRPFLCGKCLMRNRGWRVRNLGGPGPDKTED